MNLLVALGQITAVIDVGRSRCTGVSQHLSRGFTADQRRVSRHGKPQSQAGGAIRTEGVARRAQQPDTNPVPVWRWSAGLAIAFAPVFHVDAEDSLDSLWPGGIRPITDTREADLVGRCLTGQWSAILIVWIANAADGPYGTWCCIARQASAQKTVKIMFVALARGFQNAYQTILGQVTIVFP